MKFYVDHTYSARVTDRLLGYVGESDARRVDAVFDKEAGAELYVLRLDYGNGKVYELDLTDGSAKIPGSLLLREQTVPCQFCALHCEDGKYVLVRKTNVFDGIIRHGIGDATDTVPAYEESVKAVAELRTLSGKAEAAKKSAAASAAASKASADQANAAAAGARTLGITGAGVGQLAKIAAVDADGKPTAWAADDIPSGGGTETWELAADITTAEEVSAIEITEGLSGYSKLWVDLSTVVSVASNLFVNANGANATAYALFTSGYKNAGRRIIHGIIEKLPNGLIGGYGAGYTDISGADCSIYSLYDTIATQAFFLSAVSHAQAQFPVNKLRISTTGGATFKTGTLVKVWGCKE